MNLKKPQYIGCQIKEQYKVCIQKYIFDPSQLQFGL